MESVLNVTNREEAHKRIATIIQQVNTLNKEAEELAVQFRLSFAYEFGGESFEGNPDEAPDGEPCWCSSSSYC